VGMHTRAEFKEYTMKKFKIKLLKEAKEYYGNEGFNILGFLALMQGEIIHLKVI